MTLSFSGNLGCHKIDKTNMTSNPLDSSSGHWNCDICYLVSDPQNETSNASCYNCSCMRNYHISVHGIF